MKNLENDKYIFSSVIFCQNLFVLFFLPPSGGAPKAQGVFILRRVFRRLSVKMPQAMVLLAWSRGKKGQPSKRTNWKFTRFTIWKIQSQKDFTILRLCFHLILSEKRFNISIYAFLCPSYSKIIYRKVDRRLQQECRQ